MFFTNEINSRTIAHMDLDCYFVSVSRLLNPKLNGKPVIVGGGERGVVAACSYETRAFGVHSAMPIRIAKRLCPEAIIIRGDYDEYSKRSDEITEIIRERVPLFERSSIDEFYMDMSGMDKFFGCYKYATELRQKIMSETGLPISFGMSKNKTVSKVATDEIKPNGQMKVDFGDEKSFLAPLAVGKIPMIGEKTSQLLRSMGVEKVFTLQQMPPELLQNVLGENGISIWKKANGIDNTPIISYSEQKSMSQEETFEQDTIDILRMKNILIAMTEKLCFRLRSENKLTSCITVKIRYTNFDTHTIQCRIPYTSIDHSIIPRVKELFDKLFNRRMLIRLIGVKFTHLIGGGYQINLFEDKAQIINLYQAMDKMRFLFGEDKIQRAAGMNHSLRGFNPFNGISSSPAAVEKNEIGVTQMPSVKSVNKFLNLKNSENSIEKTFEYLLVINLPTQIKNEVMEVKNRFHQLFNHADAIKFPPQIILANFILGEEEEEEIINQIEDVSKFHSPFDVVLKNFNHAGTHTIFIDIENPSPIVMLLRSLNATLNLRSTRSGFSWKPHLTIANRLSKEKFQRAIKKIQQREFSNSFVADTISLLKHERQFTKYEVVREFDLKR